MIFASALKSLKRDFYRSFFYWLTFMLTTAFVFLFFCIACVILTVLSYWLIRRKKYKADAWMKIVVFGFALAGCLKLVSFWISILLILQVVLSVIVVFEEK